MKGQPFKKILGVLKQFAPTLIAATGSPLAPIAMGIAKGVLGDQAMSDEQLEEAAAAAAGTTEGLAKLREIEARLKEKEADMGVRFEEIAAADRADARAREIAMRGVDFTTRNLAYIIVFAFIAVAAGILFGWTVADSTIAGTIIGYMVGETKQVVAYYFGSSSGSKAKTELLGK